MSMMNYALRGIVIPALITFSIVQTIKLYELRNKPKVECPKVKCPTCYECIIAREKYSLYIDSLEYGLRKNRARYEDSARKYGPIVRRK